MALQSESDRFPPIPLTGPQIVVVDTAVLYNDIVYRLRKGHQTVLERTAATGAIRLLASSHVYGEMYDSLTGFTRRGLTREDVISSFERHYLPGMRFVDSPLSPIHPRVAAVVAAIAAALRDGPAFVHDGRGWRIGVRKLPRGRELVASDPNSDSA